MKNTDFEITLPQPGKHIAWVKRWIDAKFYSRIVWLYPKHSLFAPSGQKEIAYKTFEEAVKAAKDDIASESGIRHLKTVEEKIQKLAGGMDFKLGLRLAELKGKLTGQVDTLERRTA